MTVLIAMIGVVIYWMSRGELADVLHEAEAEQGRDMTVENAV